MKDFKIGDVVNSSDEKGAVDYTVVGPPLVVDDVEYTPVKTPSSSGPTLLRANLLRMKPKTGFRALVMLRGSLTEMLNNYASLADLVKNYTGRNSGLVAIVKYENEKIVHIELLADDRK